MPICIYKNRGETPLEALERLRESNHDLDKVTLSYAGRLDPMAEGAMLVLVGNENKDREKYLGLDKEYEVEILFGFATDTGDILGRVEKVHEGETLVDREKIESELENFVGRFLQPYPKYSSKSIANDLAHEDLPPKEVEVYKIKLEGTREILAEDLLNEIITDIDKVTGNFRQNEIKSKWRDVLKPHSGRFFISTITCFCGSGVYMRSLSERLGEKLGSSALAYKIKRKSIGKEPNFFIAN